MSNRRAGQAGDGVDLETVAVVLAAMLCGPGGATLWDIWEWFGIDRVSATHNDTAERRVSIVRHVTWAHEHGFATHPAGDGGRHIVTSLGRQLAESLVPSSECHERGLLERLSAASYRAGQARMELAAVRGEAHALRSQLADQRDELDRRAAIIDAQQQTIDTERERTARAQAQRDEYARALVRVSRGEVDDALQALMAELLEDEAVNETTVREVLA